MNVAARHQPGRPSHRGQSLLNNTSAMGKSSHRPPAFSQIALHCGKMRSMIHEGAPITTARKVPGTVAGNVWRGDRRRCSHSDFH